MSNCAFYACKDEGTIQATFATDIRGRQLMITSMVCDLHDKFTRGGGDLAVLFQRVDHAPQMGYPALSGAAQGDPNPPPTGGQ